MGGRLRYKPWAHWTIVTIVAFVVFAVALGQIARQLTIFAAPPSTLRMTLWVTLAVVGFAVFAHADRQRRHRRTRYGRCPRCGYDLWGATSDTCSECGADVAAYRPRA